MKKMMIALLLLIAMSSVASAVPFIGMFVDDQAVICHKPIEVYVATDVYFFALVEDIPAITACEFAVDGLPDAALAIVTPAWATPLAIGTLGYGLALAFTPAVPGPTCFLGTVGFFAMADFGPDYLMSVVETYDSNVLAVVDDEYNTIAAEGGIFTFNCSTDQCLCTPGVATEDATMSSIKALY